MKLTQFVYQALNIFNKEADWDSPKVKYEVETTEATQEPTVEVVKDPFDELKAKVRQSDLVVISEYALNKFPNVDLQWLHENREKLIHIQDVDKVAVIRC